MEEIGNSVDLLLAVFVPVAGKLVAFTVIGETVVDATEPVELAKGVGKADEGAVTPVKKALVEFADATGKLTLAEVVGTIDEGAVTPVSQMLVELADSVGMTEDSVTCWKLKPPPSSSETVDDSTSPIESVIVKLAEGVGTAITPVPKAEVKFAVADEIPIDSDAPVNSGGVGTGPEAVPTGALELVDVTGVLEDSAVPTEISVELSTDGTIVPKEMGALELAGADGTALTAVRGGAVPVRVVLAVSAGGLLVNPGVCDRERERPIRSSSSGLYDPVEVFRGGGVALEFKEVGGSVIDG